MTGAAAARISALFSDWRGGQPLPNDFTMRFRAQHPAVDAVWEGAYPRLDAALAAQDPWRGYGLWGAEAARLSAEALPSWFAGFLLWNIERFDGRFAALGLDAEFRLHFNDAFHRILAQIDADPGYARPGNDVFMKDLGLVRGTLIPALGRLLYPYAGLSLAHLLENPDKAPFVYLRCGGRWPYFGLHLHTPMTRAYFNPDGWRECHRLAALALKAFPHVRGVMAASWFYDPAATQISPHLRYLVETPLQNGARLLRLEATAAAKRDALATSASRRRAADEGTYHPRSYAMLWRRADLLALQSRIKGGQLDESRDREASHAG